MSLTREQSSAYHAHAETIWFIVQRQLSKKARCAWGDATLAEKLVFQNLAKRDLGYPVAPEAPARRPPITATEMMLLAALKTCREEFHHPGASTYSTGRDILDVIGTVIAEAEERVP